MTHMKPMAESEGEFTASETTMLRCYKCTKATPHTVETWESSCGGYVDTKCTCTVCRHVYWVDGIDS